MEDSICLLVFILQPHLRFASPSLVGIRTIVADVPRVFEIDVLLNQAVFQSSFAWVNP